MGKLINDELLNNDSLKDEKNHKHLMSKEKKNKNKRKNKNENIKPDNYTHKENHGEDINRDLIECNAEFEETTECSSKQNRKSVQLNSYHESESPHLKIKNFKDSFDSKSRKKKKTKNSECKLNFNRDSTIPNNDSNILKNENGINTITHEHIKNIENDSGNLECISKKQKSRKSDSPSAKNNKIKSKEFIETSDTDDDSSLKNNEKSKKLKKRKKEKRNDNEKVEKNRIEANDCKQTSTGESDSTSMHSVNKNAKREMMSDSDNDSHSLSDDAKDVESPVPRIKKRKVSPSELKVAKIIHREKCDNEDDIHPLQKHTVLNTEDASKLAAIRINVTYNVLPQHNVEKRAGTRVPSEEEKEEMSKYVKLKKGPFDTEEDTRIVHNWKKFCKRYNWDHRLVHPFLHLKRKGFFYITTIDERKKFVQLLAEKLPNRTLYSVYHRFRNLYSQHKVDRYSPEEDEQLLESIKKNLENGQKPNYAILAKKFNRTRASVWRRYVLLKKKKANEEDF